MVRFGNDGEARMTQPQTNEQLAYSLGAVSAGLQQMQASVASGQLTMRKDDAVKLSQALTTASDGSAALSRQIQFVATPARLGSNAVSAAMTNKFVGRAAGDNAALGSLLSQYQGLLDQARSTVDAVVAGYANTDDTITSDLHP